MSADVMIKAEPNVWVIHGTNWHCDVALDEQDSNLDKQAQAYTAAAKAIWAFKGNENGYFIVLDNGEEVPFLGTTIFSNLKGTDPNNGIFLETHVVLADQGFYNDSIEMQKLYEEDMKNLEKENKEKREAQQVANEQIKKLKKNL